MDAAIKLVIFIFWIPQALRLALRLTYWLQVKEYRFDRFKVFLLSQEGQKELETSLLLIKFLSIAFFSFFYPNYLFLTLVFLFFDFKFLNEILKHQVRRPVFTLRAVEVFGTVALAALYIVFTGNFLGGEILLLASPFLGVLWTIPLVIITKNKEIKQAQRKLAIIKPIVIGVTGSYGKTTTKEFIAQILSEKYKVAKTTGSENTEFGIARKTLSFVNKDIQVYVVEMGAYKLGEISALSKIVSPRIGVICGIEPQHLALFGSLENIVKAKFELIDSLPKDGVSVFNYSNFYCRRMADWARKKGLKVLGAGVKTRVQATQFDGVTFEIQEGKVNKRLFAPIHGTHFIQNLTLAILVARELGLSWDEIIRAVKKVKLPDKTIQVFGLKNGSFLIDDSYNTTPRGFESAIEYISLFKNNKKILFTPGIIELGGASEKTHEKIGRLAGKKIDKLILTNPEFSENILQGLGNNNKEKLEIIEDPEILKLKFKEMIKTKSVILLEGRMPKSLADEVERLKNVG